MRISAPITVSALVVVGLVSAGSATHTTQSTTPPNAPEALLAASGGPGAGSDAASRTADAPLSRTVGLLPVTPDAPRKLRAMTPSADGLPMFAGSVPLHDVVLPRTGGALGIPEVVLAAYRNAELALESSMPGCGVSWSLLAGIGRIESAHAGSGRTDAAGTTITPIFGPALDGTLPGNEVIKAPDGSAVRAIGPMQFLPGTWRLYAADGNGDGVADPHNVFDASLAAGKYLCSGGLNLRDPAQELRSVLRYNNSMAYAANVLSWSAAYRTGGTPSQVSIPPGLIPPGTAPTQPAPDMLAANSVAPSTPAAPPPTPRTVYPAVPPQVMINIPGLPPIPCGIFCPAPPMPVNPCEPPVVAAPMVLIPGLPRPAPAGPRQTYGTAGEPNTTGEPNTASEPNTGSEPVVPEPPRQPQLPAACITPDEPVTVQTPGAAPSTRPTEQPEVAETPEPSPAEPDRAAAPTPTQQPGITLPFGIVIPLPPQR
ncbi:lytic murein transglycosylase [Nocardia sp. NPDC051463]|uniref:lytic transglycosylase domain-containing protein n=1 Tax=Nocardia sp. NPDC051463 TaxID=3154845 RepID=UPI003450BA8D